MEKKIIITLATLATAAPVLAEEATAAVASSGYSDFALVAAGLGMGLAALGGALGQGRIASAAMEGIGRNPQSVTGMQTPMILGLVFVETLVLFTFVISILLVFKY